MTEISMRTLPLVAFAAAFSACGGVEHELKRQAINGVACDALRTWAESGELLRITGGAVNPDLMTCLYPYGSPMTSSAEVAVVRCQDAENWEVTRTTTLDWRGGFKPFQTRVRHDFRVAGGYVSARAVLISDGAGDARRECADGQWRQLDDKIVDLDALARQR